MNVRKLEYLNLKLKEYLSCVLKSIGSFCSGSVKFSKFTME